MNLEQTTVNGYTILRALARSNYRESYYAKNGAGQEVFLKKFLIYGNGDPEERIRTWKKVDREAKAHSNLAHDQIPKSLEWFENSDSYFLATEWIDGEDLEHMLRREGKLPEIDVLDIGNQILAVLAYVHSQGITHRDIKPSNLIIRFRDQKLIVVDFGSIKQELDRVSGGSTELTYGYFPLEAFDDPQPKTDIYSLGATMYHLLTEKHPAQSIRNYRLQLNKSDVVNEGLRTLIQDMTALRLEDRIGPAEVRRRLDELRGLPAINSENSANLSPESTPSYYKKLRRSALWHTINMGIGLGGFEMGFLTDALIWWALGMASIFYAWWHQSSRQTIDLDSKAATGKTFNPFKSAKLKEEQSAEEQGELESNINKELSA